MVSQRRAEGTMWRTYDHGHGLIRGDTSFPCVLAPVAASASNMQCYQLLTTTDLYPHMACVSTGILDIDSLQCVVGGYRADDSIHFN